MSISKGVVAGDTSHFPCLLLLLVCGTLMHGMACVHADKPTPAPWLSYPLIHKLRTKHRPEAVAHAADIKSLRALMEEVYELEGELRGVRAVSV